MSPSLLDPLMKEDFDDDHTQEALSLTSRMSLRGLGENMPELVDARRLTRMIDRKKVKSIGFIVI